MTTRKVQEVKLNGGMKVVATMLGTVLCGWALLGVKLGTDALSTAKGDIVQLREGQSRHVAILDALQERMGRNDRDHEAILVMLKDMNDKLEK